MHTEIGSENPLANGQIGKLRAQLNVLIVTFQSDLQFILVLLTWYVVNSPLPNKCVVGFPAITFIWPLHGLSKFSVHRRLILEFKIYIWMLINSLLLIKSKVPLLGINHVFTVSITFFLSKNYFTENDPFSYLNKLICDS